VQRLEEEEIIAEERESRDEKRGPESNRAAANSTARRNTIETLGSRAKEVSTSPARVASATAAANHMKGRLAPAAATNWCADPAAALRVSHGQERDGKLGVRLAHAEGG
jgi:hypothetical protein